MSVCSALLALLLAAQGPSSHPEGPAPAKTALAVRVPEGSIRLDGRPDEAAWSQARAITDFTQKEPTFGAAPHDGMELLLVYDDSALYVGARLEARNREIQAPLSQRDAVSQAEHLWISLDTYLDRQTASSFGVTASGVRLDYFHASDREKVVDTNFDPVWQAKVARDEQGWTAEFRIPFSQLRFNDRQEQVWGFNAARYIPSLNEEVFWIPVPKDQTGWSSRMGELRGISGVKPTRRIEVVPYAAGSLVRGESEEGNPFKDGSSSAGRVGADLKMGLGPNLTLQATIHPDFGQVEADPADVNLSVFETVFAEKRPFFLEGASLFQSPNFFYSRRIGGAPRGRATGDAVDYPKSGEILGAAKLTGRLASGLSVGAILAVTGRQSALVFNAAAGSTSRVPVGPQTAYSVARLKQEFGDGSTAGLLLTSVDRSLDEGSPLAAIYTKSAQSGIADWNYRFGGRAYEFGGSIAFTTVRGSPAAIAVVQRASARYFQRPDATHVHFDPTRTHLTGFEGGLSLDKISGRHWLFQTSLRFESPELERNDIGRLSAGDGYIYSASLEWREAQPTEHFRRYGFTLGHCGEWNFAGELQSRRFTAETALTWNNYWATEINARLDLPAQDQHLTRGGPTMATARRLQVTVAQSSPSTSTTRLEAEATFLTANDGGHNESVSATVAFRPTPRFTISVQPEWRLVNEARQYVATLEDGPSATYGRRYVFAHLDQATLLARLRLGLTLRPDLNLDVYAEPFVSSARYQRFGELRARATRDLRFYGEEGTTLSENADGTRTVEDQGARFDLPATDFRILSFRSNVVLRWEFRPGSQLYLVWQQDRAVQGSTYARARPGELFDAFTAPGDHIFAVKASFFWGLK